MLDLARIRRISLDPTARVSRTVATLLMAPNFYLLPGVKIEFQHAERIPNEPVIFALNHTDRYNYWPFQFMMWRRLRRFSAAWAKGKYYENNFVGTFLEHNNSVPTVSRGYLIAKDFLETAGRRPSNEEYNALRSYVEATVRGENPERPTDIPDEIWSTSRNILGMDFDTSQEDYGKVIDQLFRVFMKHFTDLHADAFEKNLDVIIFPQGTRSIRLSKGRIGLAQIALHFRRPIVPVGCNGSDKVYPGGSPFARRGRITYRFGDPITYEDMADFHINEDFQPFTHEAEVKHRDQFQGLVDMVMGRINDLVDPRYQFADDQESDGVQGTARFV